MKKHIAKRSLSALLSLLLLITACGVSGASASTWVPELKAEDGSLANQAVLQSWTDQDFANWDGEYTASQIANTYRTGGNLASVDYTVDETDTVGVRVYSTSDTMDELAAERDKNNPFTFYEVPTFFFENPDWQEGDEIRFYYEIYMEGIDQATTTYLDNTGGTRYGMMAEVYTKSTKGLAFKPTHGTNTSSWTGYNGEDGIYNFDGDTKTFSHNATYGYSAKTVYTSPATVPSGWIEDEYFIRMYPTHTWDYQNNPYRIYAFGIQRREIKDGKETWTRIANYSGEQLLSIVERQNTEYSNSHIKCEPIKMKKVNRTAVGGADGPYEIAGRTAMGNGHFSQTCRYFLYDDFAYYLNESGRQSRKGDALCNDLAVGDHLGVDFTLAFPAGFNPAVFDTSKFQVVLRARHTVSDYDQIALLNFGSDAFQTRSATHFTDPCAYSYTVTKGSMTLNDNKKMDTYRFQINIANVRQETLNMLNAGTPTASNAQNSLNLLLGTEAGYNYTQNPITLIRWSLKNSTKNNKVYMDREGAELGQSHWAGSGPAWGFAYKTATPTYKPNLMVSTYIPKGRVFTGFDSGTKDTVFTLPEKGKYIARFTLQGEKREPNKYAYSVSVIRKTTSGKILTHEYVDFIATGQEQVVSVPFYVDDLDDAYTFQINGGSAWSTTGDEKLVVYKVELITDAVATVSDGESVLLGTELNAGKGGYATMNAITVPNVTLTAGQKIRLTQKMYCPDGIYTTGPYFRVYGNNHTKVVDYEAGKAAYDNAATLTDATHGYSYKEISYDVTVGETLTDSTMYHWFFLTAGANYSIYPVRFYGMTVTDVTTGQQLYEITGEQIAKAGLPSTSVSQNGVKKTDLYSGVTYPDLDWALEDAAASGKNVTLLTDVEYTRSNVLSVPAGVTLDLAGHALTAQNLVSFGQVIDGKVGGKGTLTLVDRNGQASKAAVADLQVNNTFMPLYDSANQCYRFYDYEIVNAGYKASDNGRVVKYGYKLRFYDVSAFELLAKGDTGVIVVVDVHWDGCGFEYRHTISAKSLKDYAVSVKGKLSNTPMDSISTALVLTVSKVNHIGAGNRIFSAPTVFSDLTGVSDIGDESYYTYNPA